MGHRHVLSPSYMFETENDQRWNLTEHPYAELAHSDAAEPESSSLTYPANNMSIHGEQYTSNRNPSHVSNSYFSLPHSVQTPHYQPDATGPSNLENYANFASSSNYNRHPVHEDGCFDIRGSNGRWQYKRKTPNNNDSGSSSDPWVYHNGRDGESSVRNVRSRTECDFHDYYTTSGPTDVSSNGTTREWDPTHMSSSVHGYELNPFLVGSSNSSASIDNNGQNNGLVTRTNHLHGSQGRLRLGNADEGLQSPTDNYSSPHPRPTIAWRSSERNARGKMSIKRCRSFSEEACYHDRPMPEGLMIVDRSAFGSRNPFDCHRDMRLDIDDMGYEELLALGEQIGNVSTGLSEDQISKCLRESIYCSSDQIQEEGTCVICLEEYANMDDVGMFKGCRHDFHVGCIKKWLSMKNLCPICKSEPIKHK